MFMFFRKEKIIEFSKRDSIAGRRSPRRTRKPHGAATGCETAFSAARTGHEFRTSRENSSTVAGKLQGIDFDLEANKFDLAGKEFCLDSACDWLDSRVQFGLRMIPARNGKGGRVTVIIPAMRGRKKCTVNISPQKAHCPRKPRNY
jgi:hypothetical protein